MPAMFRLGPRQRTGSHASGFTLIELLVVLAILALLAGLVGPQILGRLSGARVDSVKLQIKNIEVALDLYRLDVGRYPGASDGLAALVDRPGDVPKWRGPYLTSRDGLIDPWGEPYRYRFDSEGGRYEILSFGADKAEGGDGENQDIRN